MQAAVMPRTSGFPYDDEAQKGFTVLFLWSNVSSTGVFSRLPVFEPRLFARAVPHSMSISAV